MPPFLEKFFEILDSHFFDNPSPPQPFLGESLRPIGAIDRDDGTALQNQAAALVNKKQRSIVFAGKVLLIRFLVDSENAATAALPKGRTWFHSI